MDNSLNKITLSIHQTESFYYKGKISRDEISSQKEEKKDCSIEIKDLDKNDEVSDDEELKNYKNEEKQLLIDKQTALKRKMEDLILNFSDEKKKDQGIYEVMQSYTKQEKLKQLKNDIQKLTEIKKNCRVVKIYISAFFFLLFYLTGFFQLLDLFDSAKKETGIVFKSFFNSQPREDNATFKELYLNSCFKNIPEFDFAFLTSFIGSLPLNYCGFFISSLCLTVVNVFLFLNFMRLDFEKTQFDFFDFFHISIYFIIFFITFGAISLFSHEKVSEGILSWNKIVKKYTEDKKEDKKETKEKGDNKKETEESKYNIQFGIMILMSFGIIFAYILNKSINYFFYHYWGKMYHDKFELVFVIIYAGSYFISLICYLGFYYHLTIIEEIDKEEKNFKKIKRNFWRVCGFLIYYEKLLKDNQELDNKQNNNDNKLNDKNNIIIYNNNYINERKENDVNQDKIIYINTNEHINTNEQLPINNVGMDNKIKTDNNNNPKDIQKNKEFEISCKEVICSILIPCYKKCNKKDENSKYICASCKLGCRKFFFYSKNNEFKTFNENCCKCCKCEECCGCCPSCQCCECCKKLELKESYEEQEIFCYIYQVQRKCSWFCGLFYKHNIFSLLIHNILIEIGIIGFEKKLNEHLENKSISRNFITLGMYLGYVVFIIVYSAIDCFNFFNGKEYKGYSKIASIFFAFDMIISALSYFEIKKFKKVKKIVNKYFTMIPIAYTKFMNFLVLDRLLRVLDKENRDILSNSLIFTSIFFLYDIIIFLITDIANFNPDNIVLFQLIFGFVVCIFFLFNCCDKNSKQPKK